MSDRVNTKDVEDVLFSIRRLVSDNDETADKKPVSGTSGKSGALFLSSSLRVHDPETEPEQVELEDMTSGFSHFREAVSDDRKPAARDYADDDGLRRAPETLQKRRLTLTEVFDDLEGIEDTPQELEIGQPASSDQVGAIEEEAPVALDVVDDASELENEAEIVQAWAKAPDYTRLADYATPEDGFARGDENAAVSDNAEPSQELPQSVIVTAADDTVVTKGADLGNLDAMSDVDEDALREMIADIVRDELSGVLGERITRNVRKLVRREIHRALMAREFD